MVDTQRVPAPAVPLRTAHRGGTGPTIASATAALAVALIAVTGWLAWADPSGRVPARISWPDLVTALAFPAVGLLVVRRQPANAVGWTFLAAGLCSATAVGAGAYADSGLDRPAAVAAAWVASWVWLPSIGAGALLLLIFPDGRFPGPRSRAAGAALAAATVLLVAGAAVNPTIQGWDVDNPVGVAGGSRAVDAVTGAVLLVTLAGGVLGALACLFVRLRRAAGDERQQLRWFAYGNAVSVATLAVGLAGPLPDLGVLGPVAVAGSAGIAIVRYRLYDIDVLVNRSLVYLGLTGAVLGVYVLTVGFLGRLLARQSDGWPALLATGVVAVAFQPMREAVQRAVDRLLYGARNEPHRALRQLGRTLTAAPGPADLLPAVARTVAEALRLPYVRLDLDRAGAFEPVASWGEPVGELTEVPLAHRSVVVGRLLAGARGRGGALGRAEVRLLEDLAPQMGVLLHAYGLSAQLTRSRERSVLALAEERRRLRRDLHDGVGPALAGVALCLGSARRLLRTDPDRADAVLAGAVTDLRGVGADIRRLVYGLRPPALDDLGLVGALRDQVERLTAPGGPTVVVVATGDVAALPAAAEVAAYRIVVECVANTVRHAAASTGTVRLDVGTGVRIEVVDDGRGLPERRRDGVGLSSVRERAAELGGTVELGPAPGGGTRVLVRLPLERAA